ncbi:MAG TPA: hypothetical protein VML19_00120, partial [Verrucomicrobiae bacterium]|nr:hypothetical protein [Verrucomicrobiae bacterium]
MNFLLETHHRQRIRSAAVEREDHNPIQNAVAYDAMPSSNRYGAGLRVLPAAQRLRAVTVRLWPWQSSGGSHRRA